MALPPHVASPTAAASNASPVVAPATPAEYQAVRVLTSVLLSPQAPTAMRAWPEPGRGSGQSSRKLRRSNPPWPVSTTARIVCGSAAGVSDCCVGADMSELAGLDSFPERNIRQSIEFGYRFELPPARGQEHFTLRCEMEIQGLNDDIRAMGCRSAVVEAVVVDTDHRGLRLDALVEPDRIPSRASGHRPCRGSEQRALDSGAVRVARRGDGIARRPRMAEHGTPQWSLLNAKRSRSATSRILAT